MAAIGERRSHTDTEGGSLGDGYPLREGPPLHCMAEPRRPGKGSGCSENLLRVGVVSPGCEQCLAARGGSVCSRDDVRRQSMVWAWGSSPSVIHAVRLD